MAEFIPQESDQVQWINWQELEIWLAQNNAPALIDVREEDKHLANNLGGDNISILEFSSHINQLDPDEPIVLYCQVGQKSFNAATLLIQADFTSVYSLKGGIESVR
ncbi:rhodanese-like domain-containing protein [Kangiella sp. TOML190]|uniref:rhodanese-like domain-containing protein n=1 Tax=Kangiella sp. TOML190 TaxID=2931351 RepID=UPI002040DBE0|nr:rhodanese-like domain-containing protein [Kangiella sp. TOML190]